MKNKYLIISILFILFLFIFCTTSFSYSTVKFDGYTFNLPDKFSEFDYHLLTYSWDGDFFSCRFAFSETPFVYESGDYEDYINVSSSSGVYSGFAASRPGTPYYDDSTKTFTLDNFEIYDVCWFPILDKFYSDSYIFTQEGDIKYYPNTPSFFTDTPEFLTTKEELESANFDYLKIDTGDTESFYLNCFRVYLDENSEVSDYTKVSTTQISSSGTVHISRSSLNLDYQNGNSYIFQLSSIQDFCIPPLTEEAFDSVGFTIGGLSSSDIIENNQEDIKDKTDEQTEAIKENTETNKGIFATLLELLSYLNPFSENFFVYKLIDLLIEALKSLFVPSSDFFLNWVNDLNSYFGDRFGIIYYPIEIVIDFLTRVGTLQTSDNFVLHVPALNLFGNVLIESFDYNFSSLLVNDTLKTIHTIYLSVVDFILYLALVILAKNIFSDIFGGNFVDEVQDDITSDERSYQRYERHQANRVRYQQENRSKNLKK